MAGCVEPVWGWQGGVEPRWEWQGGHAHTDTVAGWILEVKQKGA